MIPSKLFKKRYFPIIEHVLKKEINLLLLDKKIEISNDEMSKIINLSEQLDAGKPLAYILGYSYFYKDKFYVNSNTLIPRPETEWLVEECIHHIKALKTKRSLNIIDIGTGSGCIGISVSKYISSNHKVTLSDISLSAMHMCKKNMHKLLPLSNKVQLIESNLLKSFKNEKKTKIDIALSNLPYISSVEYKNLPESVSKYEPYLALIGGRNGYELIAELLRELYELVNTNFLIILEIGEDQGEYLEKYSSKLFENGIITVEKDIFGKDRYLRISSR